MQIFMTGATGLIGGELIPLLQGSGHQVIRLTRKPTARPDERTWDPSAPELDPHLLDGCDVLVHLAGENIASGRWTSEKKRKIRESRVHSTQLLAEAISRMAAPPKAWIVASAIGYYGDRGDEVLTEQSPPGTGFLADGCRAWEAAADPVRDRCRVVHVRTGIVLSRKGGALEQMLTPFKFGVGGVIGSGKQYWSWISIQDIARLFQFAIEQESVRGPVNGVSPQPVTNKEFTHTLGKVLSRPTILPLPAFAARLALGEMADSLILASARVIPEVAQQQKFQYLHPTLEAGLQAQGL